MPSPHDHEASLQEKVHYKPNASAGFPSDHCDTKKMKCWVDVRGKQRQEREGLRSIENNGQLENKCNKVESKAQVRDNNSIYLYSSQVGC